MKRAQAEHLSPSDILRAKKNVEKIKTLLERGVTPGQLMKQKIEMINPVKKKSSSK